jgi:hypothetical protein
MNCRQLLVSLLINFVFLVIIIRMIQKKRMDIAYCWIWLCVAFLAFVVTIKYDWLLLFTGHIGAVSPITTLFLFSIFALFLLCLQFSVVISLQRRQIKKLAQQLALHIDDI